MTAIEIRQAFLDFFASKQHTIVPSAPIVVKNDPTLMFTNAGMNQFKELFLGEAHIKYPRVADTQRCLRVSGKHDDLEEVGIDTYHHTMFEMLGNWSFGDYFKKEAIDWSWELLAQIYHIDKSRLYVTYFEGDEKEGLTKDQEAFDLWKQYLDESHILPGNKKDNFWEMGETGPCGPCSEIHYDNRPDADRALTSGAALVNADHPQVIEIWNNVFMQFNRLKDGSLMPLPAKHIDTGMGFERLVRVIQGHTSNYDTDIFMPLIRFIAAEAKVTYGQDEKQDIAIRVMADHIRAISFAIADGQLPSNNKAGYVIRRILRRAVRYAYTFLNLKEPFLNRLIPILANQFKDVFVELSSQQDFVQKVVLEEEASFLRTLATGIQRFNKYIRDDVQAQQLMINISSDERSGIPDALKTTKIDTIIKGSLAFELNDTYGFPIDLTDLMAREIGWTVDMEGFEKALQEQKTRSRAANAIDSDDWIILNEDDEVEFTGYDELETETHVLKYRKVTAKGKSQYQLVLSRTPFYAESGGQVGDTGKLLDSTRLFAYDITDTKKENGLIIHFTDMLPDNLEDNFLAQVDERKRIATENNHSATHLLHAAMKQVLGHHVNQKGSLVNGDYLRFDFSHFAKVTDVQIAEIESIVNHKVRENIPLKEERMVPYQQALQSGVTALFGEKYGDYVRVITFDDHFSKELCGGTHAHATGQIGLFKITAESAVAAGVRRIEAITGLKADEFVHQQNKLIQQLKELLKNPGDLAKSVEGLLEENSRLKKDLEKSVLEKASGLKQVLIDQVQSINGINFIAAKVDLPSAEAIKNLAYHLKDAVADLFLVLVAETAGKPSVTVMISENLVKENNLHAGNIVRELAKEINGGGGGQPFFATAGGKDVSGIPKVLEKAKTFLS
ncbi:MAG: alanine--tRNA ligase [Sphingobacteriaceae bacterium]